MTNKTIFRWSSTAMKQWDTGDIFICAASIDEARKIAFAAIEARRKPDDDEFEAAFIAALHEDIAKEPFASGDAFFIHGSA
jgi:hypothetical protein